MSQWSNTCLTAVLAVSMVIDLPAEARAQVAPSPDRIVRDIALMCEPGQAWGRPLGAPFADDLVFWLAEAAAPLKFVEFKVTPRSRRLVGAELTAGFENEEIGPNGTMTPAETLADQVDLAVAASGQMFNRRIDDETGAVFWMVSVRGDQSPLQFEILASGNAAYFACTDPSLVQLAEDEAAGRVRIERPVRRVRPARVPFSRGACEDPLQARKAVLEFADAGGLNVRSLIETTDNQSEELVLWYGQALLDQGAWTQDEREAFAEAVEDDDVIIDTRPLVIDGLNVLTAPLLSIPTDLRDDRPQSACVATAFLAEFVQAIWDANDRQWDRLTELYAAEAMRRGVTLD